MLEMRPGQPDDQTLISTMMRQMYSSLEMIYTPGVEAAVAKILADPALGRIWLLKHAGQVIGYATLSRWFSTELEGWTAYLDELWIEPQWRGKGLGSQVIAKLIAQCRADGLRTLRLELEDWNEGAERLYQRQGFKTEPRKLMTKWL
ncbi:MAG TPA: GNAT family N-acetyltransferase [Candidatus Obscuribacterales bacterium]